MRLSIVIPVYNVEPFIRGTLDSIYKQGVDESLFEVIVVNDGTLDNSMAIVEMFADAHTNLAIINQKNQGLSAARNSGIKVAKGDYIWVVDSDDSITENSISQALGEITRHPDVEMFCFDLNEQRGDKFTPTTLPIASIMARCMMDISFVESCQQALLNDFCSLKVFCRSMSWSLLQAFIMRIKTS